MNTARVVATCAFLMACERSPTPADATVVRAPASRGDGTARSGGDPAAQDPSQADADTAATVQLERLLLAAFEDGPVGTAAFEALMSQLLGSQDTKIVAAAILAAVHRAPTAALGRVAASIPPNRAEAFARALAGRPRAAGPATLPSVLLPLLQQSRPSVAAATVVGRFRLDVPELPPNRAVELLRSPSYRDQLVGARLLAARSQQLPDVALLGALSPIAVTTVARPLAAREDVPAAVWPELLRTVAARARVAPRTWGNVWRAVRDAAPTTRPEVRAELPAAIAVVQTAEGLPAGVLARLRCDNAAVLDRLAGAVAATAMCATGDAAPLAMVAQAEVLGAQTTEPARRAAALEALATAAHGDARVLVAVATAAGTLPPAVAGRILRRLARERDPAVMASVLEAIADHPALAPSVPPDLRDPLLLAPFDMPEGPTLEARVQALRVARLVGAANVLQRADTSRVRALALARSPDAGIAYRDEPPPSPIPNGAVLRVNLEFGSFEIELQPRRTPRAVAVLLAAARARRYDGLIFHRVVPSFVVQGGDPRGDGYGGTDEPVRTELSLEPFDRGQVGIPLAGMDTGGIQMFVVTADAPHLDGRYPCAGHVVRGMDVVDGILPGDRIESVDVVDTRPR